MTVSGPARRIPVIATGIVLCAVATMIGLGVWQLGRAGERDRERAAMAMRVERPVTLFPLDNPTDPDFLYREVISTCAQVTDWGVVAGKDATGKTGWARIAQCHSPDGMPFKVNAGVAATPDGAVDWQGGAVSGIAAAEPDERGIWDKVRRSDVPRRLMIVAHDPAPGLKAARPPSPLDEDNTSWGYAMQWFFFAATALVIYAIALRRRLRAERPV